MFLEGSPGDLVDSRLKLLERIKLQLIGYGYQGEEIKEGWREPLPFYVFRCPMHGYVRNYVKGYEGRLECPICLEERRREITRSGLSVEAAEG